MMKELDQKGKRQKGKDPQERTTEETFTEEEYVKLCMWLTQQPQSAAARDLSMATHMLSCCGRSDDTRLVKLADIMKPRLIRHMGEAALAISAAMKGLLLSSCAPVRIAFQLAFSDSGSCTSCASTSL